MLLLLFCWPSSRYNMSLLLILVVVFFSVEDIDDGDGDVNKIYFLY